MTAKQKIMTSLWFGANAEDAVRFYTSVIRDSKVVNESRWSEGGPFPEGTLMACEFELAGQSFLALNGNPDFKLNDSVSLFVSCNTQAEVDELWAKLGAGGEFGACGWLRDKFGLSWQIVPSEMSAMLKDEDPAKAHRVMEAMMTMTKLDIAALRRAHAGTSA